MCHSFFCSTRLCIPNQFLIHLHTYILHSFNIHTDYNSVISQHSVLLRKNIFAYTYAEQKMCMDYYGNANDRFWLHSFVVSTFSIWLWLYFKWNNEMVTSTFFNNQNVIQNVTMRSWWISYDLSHFGLVRIGSICNWNISPISFVGIFIGEVIF